MENTKHRGAANVITALSILLLAGAYLVLADYRGWWPYHAPMAENGQPSAVVYRNEQYGLQVKLPGSWKGFTVVMGTREIRNVDSGDIDGTAPTISVRHPLWTAAVPRQDIPIDVYTPEQWAGILAEKYSVSAAPIPPTELARNARYIFALPARYNYAFPAGWEEVDTIVHSGAVTAF